MKMRHVAREIPGLALTAARYYMAERMAHKVRNDEPIATDMVAFMAADVLDGEVLRAIDMDTPARRIADGFVDHVSVARVAYEVARKHPETKPYIGILAARAVVAGALNLTHLISTGEATKGRWYQKSTNLASAALALAATSGDKRVTHVTGTLAASIAIITAGAHLKDLGKKHDNRIREL